MFSLSFFYFIGVYELLNLKRKACSKICLWVEKCVIALVNWTNAMWIELKLSDRMSASNYKHNGGAQAQNPYGCTFIVVEVPFFCMHIFS